MLDNSDNIFDTIPHLLRDDSTLWEIKLPAAKCPWLPWWLRVHDLQHPLKFLKHGSLSVADHEVRSLVRHKLMH